MRGAPLSNFYRACGPTVCYKPKRECPHWLSFALGVVVSLALKQAL